MGQPAKSDRADLFGKPIGADNGWSVYFAVCKDSDFSEQKQRRAPRTGLLGGRYKRHSTVDRFWARVQKNPDGCWLFAGAKWCPAGHIYLAREDGSRVSAHRFSYELHFGPIPKGLVVMHSCDVPRCVNPAHLSVGTQRDNVHDAMAKGRRRCKGSLQPLPAHPEQPQGDLYVSHQPIQSARVLRHRSTVNPTSAGRTANPVGGRQ